MGFKVLLITQIVQMNDLGSIRFFRRGQKAKGVGVIRAEIGIKNKQIISETYCFRCFLIL